jgi:ribonuclease HI
MVTFSESPLKVRKGQAEDQVLGFRDSRHRSFNSEAQAREFVAKNSVPEQRPSEVIFHGERPDAPPSPPTITSLGGWDDDFVRIRFSIPTETQIIYTDGACPSNGTTSRRAGYGVYFGLKSPLNISARLPGRHQTNQRAELFAVLKALEVLHSHRDLKGRRNVVIFTDNMYVVNGLTNWAVKWERDGWQTTQRKEVVSKDLFKRAMEMMHILAVGEGEKIKVEIRHVPAHSGIVGNEEADQLAVAGAWMDEIRDDEWDSEFEDDELDQLMAEMDEQK